MKYFKFEIKGVKAVILEEVGEELANEDDVVAFNDKTGEMISNDLSDESKLVTVDLKTKKIEVKGKEDSYGNFLPGSIKEEIASLLREKFLKVVDAHTTIDMILYMEAMLALADRGFVITDDNREEKYLEVLETGNEELIDLLENYLIIRDEMYVIKTNKIDYNNTIQMLKETPEDAQELKDLYNSLKK